MAGTPVTGGTPRKSLSRPGWIISIVTIALTFAIVQYCPADYALRLTIAALAVCLPLFTAFLIVIAYGSRNRNPLSILVFIGSNIACIIVLFANIYWALEIKDIMIEIKDAGKDDPVAAKEKKQKYIFEDAIYFSTVTWTTLGYGDIVPTTKETRRAAATEAFSGYLIMGLLVAALTAMLK